MQVQQQAESDLQSQKALKQKRAFAENKLLNNFSPNNSPTNLLLKTSNEFVKEQKYIVTIEQIYQIDTITLEELIDEYERSVLSKNDATLSANDKLLYNDKPIHTGHSSHLFGNLSSRQARRWHQLAQTELKQRIKIQQFAFKLIADETDNCRDSFSNFQFDSFNPFLKLKTNLPDQAHISNKKQFKEDIIPAVKQINDMALYKQQIGLKLPPIRDRKNSSNTQSETKLSSVQKASFQKQGSYRYAKNQSKYQKDTLNFIDNYKNLPQSERFPQGFDHQTKFNPLLKKVDSKTKLESLKKDQTSLKKDQTSFKRVQTSQTIQVQKASKVLSKKQFLQMMKLKLNQGKDYKTGSFVRQSNSAQSTNKLHINIEKSIKNTQFKKRQQFGVTAKSKSIYIKSSLHKNQSNVSDNRRGASDFNGSCVNNQSDVKNQSTVSSKSFYNDKQKGYANSESANRSRNKTSYTSRQQVNKRNENRKSEAETVKIKQDTEKKTAVTIDKAGMHQDVSSNYFYEPNGINQAIKLTDRTKPSQITTLQKDEITENHENQNQLVKSSVNSLQNNLVIRKQANKLYSQQGSDRNQQNQPSSRVEQDNCMHPLIFMQNEDAYDDEPEMLPSTVQLQQQSRFALLNQLNLSISQNDKKPTQIQIIQLQIAQTNTQNNHDIGSDTNYQDKYQQKHLIDHSKQKQLNGHPAQQSNHYKEQVSQENEQKCTTKKTQTQKTIKVQQNFTQAVPQSVLKQSSVSKYPPYHLQFPSFSHLFHISTNSSSSKSFSLPHLLKSLEYSLEVYFQKKISEKALGQVNSRSKFINNHSKQQQLSIGEGSQQSITIKLITQLQFLKNKSQADSIFDLDLDSFKQKSLKLLKKLKEDTFYQTSGSNLYNKFKTDLKQKQTFSKKQGQKQAQKKNYKGFQTKIQAQKQQPVQKQKKYEIQSPKQNEIKKDFLFYRVVKTKPQVYDIISTSFYRVDNWLQLPHGMQLQGCWNLLWTWSKPQIDFNSLIKFQKVNHFISSKELARKDLLKKNIQKIKKLSKKLSQYFDIIPETFFLPGQNLPFIKKFRESQREGKNVWILKPVGLSRGRGISLISKLEEVVFSEPIVMQKYIDNPFLLDDYKFDLRIYVLVTSINPLECFVYREGFARVSTQRYSKSLQQIGNKFVHLTNYSIQKDSEKCPSIFSEKEKLLGGCKLTLKMLKDKFRAKGIEWSPIWQQIEEVVLKSLISCMKYIPQNPNCFQLFGYDIMIDSNMKCWLIEVNSSPSLQKDFLIDQIVKQQLVDDTIQLVDPIQYDRAQLLKVIKRRRKEFQGLKSHVNFANNSHEQLNQDIFRILQGKTLRNYGQIKKHNNFSCLAPGPLYDRILKTVQHYTHDSFVKDKNFY